MGRLYEFERGLREVVDAGKTASHSLTELSQKFKELHEKAKAAKSYENTCVCCGTIIPEGTQVCPTCIKQ